MSSWGTGAYYSDSSCDFFLRFFFSIQPIHKTLAEVAHSPLLVLWGFTPFGQNKSQKCFDGVWWNPSVTFRFRSTFLSGPSLKKTWSLCQLLKLAQLWWIPRQFDRFHFAIKGQTRVKAKCIKRTRHVTQHLQPPQTNAWSTIRTEMVTDQWLFKTRLRTT